MEWPDHPTGAKQETDALEGKATPRPKQPGDEPWASWHNYWTQQIRKHFATDEQLSSILSVYHAFCEISSDEFGEPTFAA